MKANNNLVRLGLELVYSREERFQVPRVLGEVRFYHNLLFHVTLTLHTFSALALSYHVIFLCC